MKASYVVRSSGGPRKDFARRRIPSRRMALEARLDGNVTFPGKIMADSETQKLERKDFFQRIVEKVDGGCFLNPSGSS